MTLEYPHPNEDADANTEKVEHFASHGCDNGRWLGRMTHDSGDIQRPVAGTPGGFVWQIAKAS